MGYLYLISDMFDIKKYCHLEHTGELMFKNRVDAFKNRGEEVVVRFIG